MDEGARVANEEMFRRDLIAKLNRIIELLEKQQAVEHSVHLTGLTPPSADELAEIIIRGVNNGSC